MSTSTIQDVRKYVDKEMGGSDAALVVVSALVVGPNIQRITQFTGLPHATVREYAKRLRDNRIWVGSRISVDSEEGPDGIETALWVSVAEGYLETVPA